jgi:hypothetical protein
MLERLRRKIDEAGADNVEIAAAGFLTYDHRDDPADIVYSRYALHHLPDFWKVVALRRVQDDQPALVIQRPGTELGEPLGGSGDEPAAHRALRGPRRRGLDGLADRFERPLLAAPGPPRQHPPMMTAWRSTSMMSSWRPPCFSGTSGHA